MQNTTAVIFVTYIVQAAGAALVAVVFRSFQRHYQRGYLHYWTQSWFALCLALLGGTAALLTGRDGTGHLYALAIDVMTSAAGYLQIGWLLLGTRELTARRAVSVVFVRRILWALGLLGAASAAALFWDPDSEALRYLARVGVRSVAAGVAFCLAAVAVWRAERARVGLGHRLVCVSFFVYGLEQFPAFGVGVAAIVRGSLESYATFVGFFDFLVQFAMALGMVIWLLEDERQSTADAARQIEHLAYHDTLTGLPNRQLFLDRLGRAIASAHRTGHQLAVFFLDLDRFKLINDSLGHSVGDRLLQVVAERMRHLLREEDTVTRLGGDEFTILAPKVRHVEDAVTVARKVRDAVKHPVMLDGREFFISTSIGISMYPSDGEDGETLLKNADTAMYRAKATGRDTFQLYAPAMNAKALEQLALENGLRRAIVNDELELHYQPIIEMATERIVAFETVLRWRHSALGLLRPDNFIVLAEATGMILPIGEWVLRRACEQVRAWQRLGRPELRASVNLSPRQLQQPGFVRFVSQVLAETGLAPETLELEVTETMAMQSDDETVAKLRELKRMGVRIAIDDFGTGYSSLSALRLFPVDALKIDQSFVRDIAIDPNDAAIAAAVIALARTLRLSVIAEGVESDRQLAFLREQHCDYWQGYLHSRPATAAACEELLTREAEKV